MAKLLTTMEIKKQIRVLESWLSGYGLNLHFMYGEKERFAELSPTEAAKTLKELDLIKDYCRTMDELMLEIEIIEDHSNERGEHVQKESTVKMSWDMFALHYHFSQIDAIAVATTVMIKENTDNFLNDAVKEAREKMQAV